MVRFLRFCGVSSSGTNKVVITSWLHTPMTNSAPSTECPTLKLLRHRFPRKLLVLLKLGVRQLFDLQSIRLHQDSKKWRKMAQVKEILQILGKIENLTSDKYLLFALAMKHHKKQWMKSRLALGRATSQNPSTYYDLSGKHTKIVDTGATATIARQNGVAYGTASYWRKKVENPTIHNDSWGGRGRVGYSPEDRLRMKEIVCRYLLSNPQPNLLEIVAQLRENGYPYSRASVSGLLKSWRWSFKIPTVFQKQKFTPGNLNYYNQFVEWLEVVNLASLKFVDEVHFDRRGTTSVPPSHLSN